MAYVESTKLNSEANKAAFKRTSSLNKYCLCDHCLKKFASKNLLRKHVFVCLSERTCRWCKIQFKNRGNLVTHAYYVHDDKEIKKKSEENTCMVCEKSFCNSAGLKYHIRREHYNLITKIPITSMKKVNEVWYEKVLNSDCIVEITKVRCNLLLLKKFNGDTSVDIQECNDMLDLRDFYATGKRSKTITCDICKKDVLSRTFKKHYEERHGKVKRHHCNNCNMSFKRSYFFVRHQCNKQRKKRGGMDIHISRVESLTSIPI